MNTAPFDFAFENYPLAPLTLYNVGGPARLALVPRTINEARDAYEWMRAQDTKRIVLGGGSNVLIDDNGFDGIVMITSGLTGVSELGDHRYSIESGVVLDHVVTCIMIPNNYALVGALTGIPGSVGGAIYMNAGTVNGSTCMLLESVEVMTPADGYACVPMSESLYSYRGQTFCPRGGLILGGVFRFEQAAEDQRAIYDHYIQRRKEKQPQGKCCGSVFKNPNGDHAGRLIEACGLKGTRHGGAVISPMHANFIMNEDNATSADILALIALVKKTVHDTFGVKLEEEVVYIN
ncbi:MAG: UDP-N-acetylmuramate dehydrogenase [Candidatus Hydrogenedentes bacterium]|nr:UDP-N-acetylmuramate dehydrogenase [Candidatus Hydrogenedentota bacterium]